LLYDPPETELLEFASYADPFPVAFDTDERDRGSATEQSSDAAVLSIVRLEDPYRAKDDAHWYRDTIIGRSLLQSVLDSILQDDDLKAQKLIRRRRLSSALT
jgi:hypothetical protein